MQTRRYRYAASALKRSHTLGLLISTVAIPTITLIGMTGIQSDQTLSLTALWQAFARSDSGGWDGEFLAIVAAAILAIVIVLVQRRSFVELGPSGLTLSVPRLTGLGLTGITTGNRSILWHQIKALRLTPVRQPRQVAQAVNQSILEIDTDRDTIRLTPFHFLDSSGPDHRFGLWETARFRKLDLPARLRQAPLIQELEQRGYTIETADPEPSGPSVIREGFDLRRHKGLLTQLGLLSVFGGYALFEWVGLTEYQMLGDAPIDAFMISGVAALAICLPLGKGAPRLERFGVGALLVAASLAATYPAMIRYTLLTTPMTERITYHNTKPGIFEADGHPLIDLRDKNLDAYWRQFAAGDPHRFTLLRHPDASFQLLDLRPLYERTRAFYQKRNAP